jgi:hypothetical protein
MDGMKGVGFNKLNSNGSYHYYFNKRVSSNESYFMDVP